MALTKVQTIGIETGISLTGVTSAVNLNVTGITTVGVVSATSLNVSGVITATNFVGSGSQLTGVASTDNIRTNTNATFLQNINVTGIVTAAGVNASGVITATSFSGSGANLTGLAATANVTTSSLVVIGVSTVAAGSAAAPSITPTGDSNTGIFFPSADTIAFGEGGSEAARIDSSGRFGIGTTSPNELLEVRGTENQGIRLTSTATSGEGANLQWYSEQSGDNKITAEIESDGESTGGNLQFKTRSTGGTLTERVRLNSIGDYFVFSNGNDTVIAGNASGAGTSQSLFTGVHSRTSTNAGGTVSVRIYNNGNIENTNNSYGQLSDIKLKENVVDANSQWADIKALQVRNYNFKEGQTHTQIGLVAQEVELVSPGLVSESPDRDEDGNDLGTVTKSVQYSVLYMKAVKALQEAMDRIETLEASNADLLARVSALESA